MTGIDGDDDIALATRHGCQLGRWLGRRDGHRRRGVGDARRLGARWRTALIEQVDHQAMPVLLVRRQGKALRRDRRGQVDDHPQIVRAALGGTHPGDRGIGQRQLVEVGGQLGATDVDDDAIRRRKGEDAVLHRPGQVEDQARVVGSTPEAHAAHIRGSQGLGSQSRQQNTHSGNQRAYAHTQPHRFLLYCLLLRASHQASPRAPCPCSNSERPPAWG